MRESPLLWSFPFGTWLQTRVRVSVFFPLILAIMCFRYELELGASYCLILFVSVLLHEFGHIIGARRTGGSGSEILLWPLGGLAFVHPARTFSSQFITAASGPLVNLFLCAATLFPLMQTPHLTSALNPLTLPSVTLRQNILSDLMVLTFSANWLLLLVNLIPVFPLDGGRMLQATLMARHGKDVGNDIYSRVGLFFSIIVIIVGLFANNVWVVVIGAVILIMNFQETQQLRHADNYDESFMGYDFSQGYTSLEKADHDPPPPKKSWLTRRREKKLEEKQKKLQEQIAAEDGMLDSLLEKVHLHGIDSLSESEKRILAKASARYRNRNKQNQ